MIAALILAMATVGPPAPATTRRQTVAVRWVPEGKACIPAVHGVETGDIATDAGKAALVAALPDTTAPLHLLGGASVPYACTIAIVDTLKHEGFTGPFSLVSQPAAPRP